jgi:hypothetical protein
MKKSHSFNELSDKVCQSPGCEKKIKHLIIVTNTGVKKNLKGEGTLHKLYWRDHTEIEQNISPIRCLLSVIGILLLGVFGFVLIVIGLGL